MAATNAQGSDQIVHDLTVLLGCQPEEVLTRVRSLIGTETDYNTLLEGLRSNLAAAEAMRTALGQKR